MWCDILHCLKSPAGLHTQIALGAICQLIGLVVVVLNVRVALHSFADTRDWIALMEEFRQGDIRQHADQLDAEGKLEEAQALRQTVDEIKAGATLESLLDHLAKISAGPAWALWAGPSFIGLGILFTTTASWFAVA
jgi:hypothetical protein